MPIQAEITFYPITQPGQRCCEDEVAGGQIRKNKSSTNRRGIETVGRNILRLDDGVVNSRTAGNSVESGVLNREAEGKCPWIFIIHFVWVTNILARFEQDKMTMPGHGAREL
jgi:hypothetical protein